MANSPASYWDIEIYIYIYVYIFIEREREREGLGLGIVENGNEMETKMEPGCM